MKYSLLALFISVIPSFLVISVASTDQPIECGDFPILSENEGTLKIQRKTNQTMCGYKSSKKFFAVRSDFIDLKQGEILKLLENDANEVILSPPFPIGWIACGLNDISIEFKFDPRYENNTKSMYLDYVKDEPSIPVNADKNNDFLITTYNLEALQLIVNKTTDEYVHLSIEGAQIDGSSNHRLVTEDNSKIPLKFAMNSQIKVKTTIVWKNCSSYQVLTDKPYELIGPDVTSISSAFECVNIFSSKNENHFDVDFKNFLGLTDAADQLILDDGSSIMKVDEPKDEDLIGQNVTLQGNNLVVIYKSPSATKSSKLQFKATILVSSVGGIISQGIIKFPGSGPVRFVLRPESKHYASITMPKDFKLQGVNLTISSGGKQIANFLENSKLPPVIALNDQDVDMVLEFSGKLSSLQGSINFTSLESHCHQISGSASSSFSIYGNISGPCYWVLGTSDYVDVNINYNDLAPNGCLSIHSQNADKPIYSKCGVSKKDVLPTFTLKQAYLNISTTSKDMRFDASSSLSQIKLGSQLEPKEAFDLSSSGYPISYPWFSENEVIKINGTGKSYSLHIDDVDLRSGEKLMVNQTEITNINKVAIGDIFLQNSTTEITIKRSSATSDFANHRGYSLSARQFEHILVADINKQQITTPNNSTSIILKISSPGSPSKNFGKRIAYNITIKQSTLDSCEVLINDGRSIQKQAVNLTKNTYQGFSTSDTVIVTYRSIKPGVYLPPMTIDYKTNECNRTIDHICDQFTRCVTAKLLCGGISYCEDGTDLKVSCNATGPAPNPKIIETGASGVTVFILCIIMLTIGAVGAIYGPDLFKNLENRFRSGHYTTFTSVE